MRDETLSIAPAWAGMGVFEKNLQASAGKRKEGRCEPGLTVWTEQAERRNTKRKRERGEGVTGAHHTLRTPWIGKRAGTELRDPGARD